MFRTSAIMNTNNIGVEEMTQIRHCPVGLFEFLNYFVKGYQKAYEN